MSKRYAQDRAASIARAATRLYRQPMIHRQHDLTVTRQATLLGLSRASVYYVRRAIAGEDLAVMRRLDALHLERRRRTVACCVTCCATKASSGRDRVRTLMRRMGISAIYRPHQVWATDITYIPMSRGSVLLCAIVD